MSQQAWPRRRGRGRRALTALLGAVLGLVGPARPAVAATYLVVPADSSFGFSANKGYTLGGFAGYPLAADDPPPESCDPPGSAPCPDGTGGATPTGGGGGVPPGGDTQSESVDVTVPNAQGVFTMSVDNSPVMLSTAMLDGDDTVFESTGQLGAVTITDGRHQTGPGWSVSGQVSDFADGGHTLPGSDLGWTPMIIASNPAGDVAAGPTVAPGSRPGLSGGSPLATASAGRGLDTTTLGAALDLRMPSITRAGTYTATLTVTAVEDAW